jgi:prepilin-type processing-associated H-X9-DG protein
MMKGYIGGTVEVYRCPADPFQDRNVAGMQRSSYMMRHAIDAFCESKNKPLREVMLKRPSAIALAVEEAWHNPTGNIYCWDNSGTDSSRRVNAVFADGHCTGMDQPRTNPTGAPGFDINWHIYGHGWAYDELDPHDVQ